MRGRYVQVREPTVTQVLATTSTMVTDKAPDWEALTSEQLAAYQRDGFLHLRGAFSADEVARGLDVVEAALEQAEQFPTHASFADYEHTTRIRNAVSRSEGLDYFLDHPALIGPLMSVLNNSVHILGTEIFVRSVEPNAMEFWHTDGGEYLQRIQVSPESPSLQLKAQVFLTDTTTSKSGNFILLPGSHRRLPDSQNALCYMEELDEPLRRGVLPPEAIEVKAAPGDVLLFPYPLWHAVAPNLVQERKTFIFRYGQLWHRPHDYFAQPEHVLARMSPRLRRMFGDFGANAHPSDFYKPMLQGDVMATSGCVASAVSRI